MFKLTKDMIVGLSVVLLFLIAIVLVEYGKYILPPIFVAVAVYLFYKHDNKKKAAAIKQPLCNCKLCHDVYYFGEYRSDLQELMEQHRKDIERSHPNDLR